MEASGTTPVAPGTAAQPGDNWFRKLKDDRLEVFLQGNGLKLRASGEEADMWALVEQFEQLTGLAVEGEWRRPPRTGARPLEGQLSLMEEPSDGED